MHISGSSFQPASLKRRGLVPSPALFFIILYHEFTNVWSLWGLGFRGRPASLDPRFPAF